ncbi:hypothetical protein BDR26DRAFT_717656 [Obelidium mucronatum]|nr:hypothetical protein BDR26DRAFT_717656 [Obelidium mucronatum]
MSSFVSLLLLNALLVLPNCQTLAVSLSLLLTLHLRTLLRQSIQILHCFIIPLLFLVGFLSFLSLPCLLAVAFLIFMSILNLLLLGFLLLLWILLFFVLALVGFKVFWLDSKYRRRRITSPKADHTAEGGSYRRRRIISPSTPPKAVIFSQRQSSSHTLNNDSSVDSLQNKNNRTLLATLQTLSLLNQQQLQLPSICFQSLVFLVLLHS